MNLVILENSVFGREALAAECFCLVIIWSTDINIRVCNGLCPETTIKVMKCYFWRFQLFWKQQDFKKWGGFINAIVPVPIAAHYSVIGGLARKNTL